MQKVDRFEIIPVDTQKRTAVAIDSTTGKPYYFSNVASGGHSNGTEENPFGKLGEGLAQVSGRPGAIVYVSGGAPFDAQAENLDGYTLSAGTSILGAGASHGLLTQHGLISLASRGSTP